MTIADSRLVVDVHLMGAAICSKAVWQPMRVARHGRIVMTTSLSGLYGNFGQTNYGAAEMALVGLMQTLALEGERNGIRVNRLAPTAANAMTAEVLDEESRQVLAPERVSPALLALVGDDAPTRAILCAGAGRVAAAHVMLTDGVQVGIVMTRASGSSRGWADVVDRTGEIVPAMASLRRNARSPHSAPTKLKARGSPPERSSVPVLPPAPRSRNRRTWYRRSHDRHRDQAPSDEDGMIVYVVLD